MTAEDILLAADRACFVAKRTGIGLIATADEGLAIARDFSFKEPTPIDATDPNAEHADGRDDRTQAREPGLSEAFVGLPAPPRGPARRASSRPATDASPAT